VTLDALLAYAHFLSIFALASMLTAELLLFRQTMAANIFQRLRLTDRWYGIIAGLVIVTGLLRLNFGLKGAAYYIGNPIFWTKMGLFLVVALLSIPPTITFIRWQNRVANGVIALEASEYGRMMTFLRLEIALFVLIPLCAVFMARGFR